MTRTRARRFHYMLSNPPYGVDWKKYQEPIKDEAETLGFDGRFGAGLPRISDGQLLFLQHMISKMRDDETARRIGIVMNGSPLFTGGAGSGESEIRRWMLENDLGRGDRRPADRPVLQHRHPDLCLAADQPQAAAPQGQGAADRRLRRAVLEAHAEIARLQAAGNPRGGPQGDRAHLCRVPERRTAASREFSKIFDAADFGYREIRVERPLRLNFQASQERIARLAGRKGVPSWIPSTSATTSWTRCVGIGDDALSQSRRL